MRLYPLLAIALAAAILSTAAVATEPRPQEPGTFATATFAMYCYWTGEATLGKVDGVVASRIGHWGGNEIVQVDYDSSRTSVGQLIGALERQNSFYSLVLAEGEDAPTGVSSGKIKRHRGQPRFIEPKHSLRTRHPELYALDLSERQAIALNTWSYFGGPMPDVLTDEQKRRIRHP